MTAPSPDDMEIRQRVLTGHLEMLFSRVEEHAAATDAGAKIRAWAMFQVAVRRLTENVADFEAFVRDLQGNPQEKGGAA